MEESKQSEIIKLALENAKSILNEDTVLGKPVTVTGGTTIIPVSKISVGVASGGLDYFGKSQSKSGTDGGGDTQRKNFGGGGGTGINVSPLGFLVISSVGNVELLTLDSPARDLTSHLFEFISNSPEFFEKIKNSFISKGKNE